MGSCIGLWIPPEFAARAKPRWSRKNSACGWRGAGWNDVMMQCWVARGRKISTPELNRWLKEDVDLQRGSTPKARPVRIYYITQAKVAPPSFVIFTNQKKPLHFSYGRFLENRLREKYDFVGTP